jgi:hypothetical protein
MPILSSEIKSCMTALSSNEIWSAHQSSDDSDLLNLSGSSLTQEINHNFLEYLYEEDEEPLRKKDFTKEREGRLSMEEKQLLT